jgi:hypothetical protein
VWWYGRRVPIKIKSKSPYYLVLDYSTTPASTTALYMSQIHQLLHSLTRPRTSQIWFRASGSRLVVGSSRKSTRCPPTTDMPIDSRRRIPPLRLLAGL